MKKRISFESIHPDLEIPNPRPAGHSLPQWHKESLSVNNGVRTFKECAPFLDSMTTGYTITLSADVFFNKGSVQDISKHGVVQIDSSDQLGNLKTPPEYYKKLYTWINSFVLKTPNGYSTFFTNPVNRIDLPFYTFSGLVDTDKFPIQTNFPFLIRKDFVGIIPAGTPIAQAIPIKREDWISSVKESSTYTTPEFVHTMNNPPFNFYKKNFWIEKKYN